MLETERLMLRLFRISNEVLDENDLDEVFSIDQDPVVMKYINGGKVTTRKELEEVFVPRIKSYTDFEKGYGMWRVALKNTNQCIGELIVRPMDFASDNPKPHDLELGWRFIQSSWGNGYATEAAQALIDKMKSRPEVTHFSAIADTENKASTKIMQKLGMRFIKHYVHSDPLGDFDVDLYQLAIND